MPWPIERPAALTHLRYEWFLETWDAYPFNIERADAIRYFVLHHYGGIYIDLDDVSFESGHDCFKRDANESATGM